MREDIIIGIDSRPADAGGNRVIRKLSDILGGANATGAALDRMAAKGGKIEALGRGGDRAAGGMARLGQQAGAADRQLQYLIRDLEATNRAAGGATGRFNDFGGALGRGIPLLRTFGGLLGGLTFVGLTRAALAATDSLKRIEAQIRLTQTSATSFNQAFADVQRIAGVTRGDLGATAELYGRIARQQAALGISAREAATMTENYAKTLKISGASGLEAAASMRQFSQAIARGSLRGDEFVSMLENNSRMTQLLADSLGVAQGELIKLAGDGKITGDVIKKALIDPKFGAQLAAEFALVPVTFEDAMTQLKNAATVTLGEFDSGGQFSKWIIDFIGNGVDGFEDLGDAASDFGIEFRSAVEGLGGAFEPVLDAGKRLFAFLGGEVLKLRDSIASLLGSWDDITGFPQRLGNAAKRFDNQFFGTDWQMGALPDSKGRFLRNYDQGQRRLEADRAGREFNDSLPRGMQWGTDPAGLKRWATTGSSLEPRPKSKPPGEDDEGSASKTRTNQQVLNDFARELRARGVMPLPGVNPYRTAAQQNALYQQKKTPLDGYTRLSRHQNWQAIDIVKETWDDRKVAEAAAAAGLKDWKPVLESGGRRHIEWKGHGKPGDIGDRLNDQEAEAERLAKEMQKVAAATKDYWEGLTSATALAKMLPEDAEQLSEEMKLQRAIQNDLVADVEQITQADKDRIRAQLELKRIAEIEGQLVRGGRDVKHEAMRLDRERAIIGKGTLEQQEMALALEREMWPLRLQILQVTDEKERKRLELLLAIYEKERGITQEKERQNRKTEEGNAFVRDVIERNDPYARLRRERAEGMARIANSNLSPAEKERATAFFTKEMEKAYSELRNDFYDKFRTAIDELGEGLGGVFQKVIGNIAKIGTMIVQMLEKGYQAGTIGANSSDPLARGLSGLQSIAKTMQGQMDPNSKGAQFLGKAGGILGAASDGAAMGGMISGIAPKSMGSKGASIGGAIGGSIGMIAGSAIGGPIGGMVGSLIGSILGSIAGGLIDGGDKPPNGETNIIAKGGMLGIGRSTGPSDMQASNKNAAGSVISGIYQIADALGATLNPSAISVGIGQRNNKWIVDERGLGRTKGDGTPSFASAQEAVMYAIKDAIKDGVITGLSAASNRVLKSADDPLGVLNAVAAYENLDDALLEISDPTRGSIEAFVKQMKALDGQLRRAGYTTEELGKLQELYAAQRKELMKNLTQPFRDFIEQITMGPGSGKSVALQYADAKTKFAGFAAKLAAGERVDQDEFLTLSKSLFDLSSQMFGTTTEQFALDRQMLVDAANKAIENIEAIAPEELIVDAIETAGSAIVTEQQETNTHLETIIDLLSGNASTPSTIVSGSLTASAAAASIAYIMGSGSLGSGLGSQDSFVVSKVFKSGTENE